MKNQTSGRAFGDQLGSFRTEGHTLSPRDEKSALFGRNFVSGHDFIAHGKPSWPLCQGRLVNCICFPRIVCVYVALTNVQYGFCIDA
jgi:hypothetical protein